MHNDSHSLNHSHIARFAAKFSDYMSPNGWVCEVSLADGDGERVAIMHAQERADGMEVIYTRVAESCLGQGLTSAMIVATEDHYGITFRVGTEQRALIDNQDF